MEESFALVEELRSLAKRAIQEQRPELRHEAASRIGQLSLEDIVWMLRVYTAFFMLVNLSEQQEIVRINRMRAVKQPDVPRAESIDEAVSTLKAIGFSYDQVMALITGLDIQPTLTAHPTDARRRTILYKLQDLAALFNRFRGCQNTPDESSDLLIQIYGSSPF